MLKYTAVYSFLRTENKCLYTHDNGMTSELSSVHSIHQMQFKKSLQAKTLTGHWIKLLGYTKKYI